MDAGCAAAPALLEAPADAPPWHAAAELPAAAAAAAETHARHSVFVCPVSRSWSTAAADDPPLRLVCGHVVGRAAATSMAAAAHLFKCPYCPVAGALADAVALKLM